MTSAARGTWGARQSTLRFATPVIAAITLGGCAAMTERHYANPFPAPLDSVQTVRISSAVDPEPSQSHRKPRRPVRRAAAKPRSVNVREDFAEPREANPALPEDNDVQPRETHRAIPELPVSHPSRDLEKQTAAPPPVSTPERDRVLAEVLPGKQGPAAPNNEAVPPAEATPRVDEPPSEAKTAPAPEPVAPSPPSEQPREQATATPSPDVSSRSTPVEPAEPSASMPVTRPSTAENVRQPEPAPANETPTAAEPSTEQPTGPARDTTTNNTPAHEAPATNQTSATAPTEPAPEAETAPQTPADDIEPELPAAKPTQEPARVASTERPTEPSTPEATPTIKAPTQSAPPPVLSDIQCPILANGGSDPDCEAAVTRLLRDQNNDWVSRPPTAADYVSGARLVAFAKLRNRLACQQLSTGLTEAQTATVALRAAIVGEATVGRPTARLERTRELAVDVQARLEVARDERC